MKGLEFPIIGTKVKGLTRKFDLTDRSEREKYFEAKAGPEIKEIKRYLKTGTFLAFMVGKKNSGKGTYSNMLKDIFGADKIVSVGVGDLVKEVHANWESYAKSDEYKVLKRMYRGFISFEEAVDRLHGRSTASLVPSEFVLALLKARISTLGRRAVLVDGLPRDIDQISYSLFFRDLANFRDDPDMFVLIDIPMSVIDERIKYRVVCPKCKNSRNLKLLVTKDIRFDEKTNKFELYCDNPECKGVKLEPKEGDDLGIKPILPRLEKDEDIIKKVFALHGIPKIMVRNHVPVTEAKLNFDDYELTPEYILSRGKDGKVAVKEKNWTVKDDNGVESHSLQAPAVVVAMIKQLADVLELE